MNDHDDPISIACGECSNQIEKTYEQLVTNEALECPACGHHMTAERAAVVRHIAAIRRAMAGVRRRA
jgi:DNA-directed RNA polymerase subunit RPC12/RpoP